METCLEASTRGCAGQSGSNREDGQMTYNGFQVEVVGPVVRTRGGWVRLVRLVANPEVRYDREFNAVCDSHGNLKG